MRAAAPYNSAHVPSTSQSTVIWGLKNKRAREQGRTKPKQRGVPSASAQRRGERKEEETKSTVASLIRNATSCPLLLHFGGVPERTARTTRCGSCKPRSSALRDVRTTGGSRSTPHRSAAQRTAGAPGQRGPVGRERLPGLGPAQSPRCAPRSVPSGRPSPPPGPLLPLSPICSRSPFKEEEEEEEEQEGGGAPPPPSAIFSAAGTRNSAGRAEGGRGSAVRTLRTARQRRRGGGQGRPAGRAGRAAAAARRRPLAVPAHRGTVAAGGAFPAARSDGGAAGALSAWKWTAEPNVAGRNGRPPPPGDGREGGGGGTVLRNDCKRGPAINRDELPSKSEL